MRGYEKEWSNVCVRRAEEFRATDNPSKIILYIVAVENMAMTGRDSFLIRFTFTINDRVMASAC